jgi:hypothetical protein
MEDISPTDSVMQDERRPIPGYEGLYEMDQAANIYALFPFKGRPIGRKMKTMVNRLGYVRSWLSKDATTKQYSVHRLVMLTWRPVENSRSLDVNHIDGNKQNNHLDNLEWVTHKANIHHARNVLGINRDQRGDKAGYRKLTSEIVREIRSLYAQGVQRSVLAKKYGVTWNAITNVISRKSWGSVE